MAKVSDKIKVEAIIEALTSQNTLREALEERKPKSSAPGGYKLQEEDVPQFTKAELLFFLRQKNLLQLVKDDSPKASADEKKDDKKKLSDAKKILSDAKKKLIRIKPNEQSPKKVSESLEEIKSIID